MFYILPIRFQNMSKLTFNTNNMPKLTTFQIAKAKTINGKYEVIQYKDEKTNKIFYQLRKNRRVINNYSDAKNNQLRATKDMFNQALYDLLNLYEEV